MRFALAIGLMLATAAPAMAQSTVSLTIQRGIIRKDVNFTLTLSISGSGLESITWPEVEGFTVENRPYKRSNNFSIVNGVARSTAEMSYEAVVRREGQFTIPPVEIIMDGQAHLTDSVTFVVGASAPPRAAARPRAAEKKEEASDSLTWEDWDEFITLNATADKTEAFRGEPITVTLSHWQLKHAYFMIHAGTDLQRQQISTPGFYVAELDATRRSEQYRGLPYDVREYRKVLFPVAVGDLTIGSWNWQGRATRTQGFASRNYKLTTDPITITVKPLPKGPPAFSGAVGQFTVRSTLSVDQVIVGTPTHLVIQVTGNGNPEAIGAPTLPTIENAQVSGPESMSTPAPQVGGHAVSKQFAYQIIPKKPGTLTIPETPFVYFDPTIEEFVTETTEPFDLRVMPAAEGQQRIVADADGLHQNRNQSVAIVGRDIRGLISSPGPLYPSNRAITLFPVALATPALAYAGLAIMMARRRRFDQDSRLARSHFARSRGRKRLADVAEASDPSKALYDALTGFIADKFNVSEAGITSHDAASLFDSHGVEGDLAAHLEKTLRACERVNYGGAQLSGHELTALIEGTTVNMDRLDEILKKGRRS